MELKRDGKDCVCTHLSFPQTLLSLLRMALVEATDLNLDSLKKYLIAQDLCTANSILSASRFSAGTSNPTYLIDGCKTRLVVRRKPYGPLLKGAHQVDREYKVTSELYKLNYPVARPYCYCDDKSVIGSEFYVSQFVPGRVFHDSSLSGLPIEQRTQVYSSLVDVLSKLHEIDVSKYPSLTSLASSSKANTPYMERQIKSWYQNFTQSLVTDNYEENTKLLMDKLNSYLLQNVPRQKKTCLVHGDFKLDQVIIHETEPRVICVLDWELVTLGDPLADFAYMCGSFMLPPGIDGLLSSPYQKNGEATPGVPTLDSLLFLYSSKSGLIPSAKDWNVYQSYVCFRIACIIQGILGRLARGTSFATNPNLRPSVVTAFAFRAAECVGLTKAEISLSLRTLAPSIPPLSPRATGFLTTLLKFMKDNVYGENEERFEREMREQTLKNKRFGAIPSIVEELKLKAKKEGLWNLFLPDWSGISNRDYATLAEIMGRNLWIAECFNCQFPDTGNMETLHLFGNKNQNETWLEPLKQGKIRSAFVMTEPGVASSDAVQLKTRIERNDSSKTYKINGSKWWISGAGDPRCKVFLVLGDTSINLPEEERKKVQRHRRHSIVIVPVNTPGVKIKTPMTAYGYDDAPFGHFEVDFVDVIVPQENLLKEEGAGFEIAQARLGPGRIHHCMRTIGLAQRALELIVHRMRTRTVQAGTPLEKLGSLRAEIADLRIQVEQARLLVLRAATAMDEVGAKNARALISMCKVQVPKAALAVIDRGIQIHGAVGMSHQFPLASWFVRTRTVRFMDGPDASHLEVIAKDIFAHL